MTLDPNLPIGAALKAGREALGLSLDEIAEATRVRPRHLAAIEDMELDALPARPFAIGYVRAYAKELGADADAAAVRFREENPSLDDHLHSPAGVTKARSARARAMMLAGGAALLAIVGWNLTLHAMATGPHKTVAAPTHVTPPPSVAGPFVAGRPLPPPAEASAPTAYETPIVTANTAVAPAASNAAVASAVAPTFVAGGTIYGDAKGASPLIIQATSSISLEVRGPGGVVYFAHQLHAGEAYRVPALPNLTAEVSNPASAALYENGVSKGPFAQAVMPLKIAS